MHPVLFHLAWSGRSIPIHSYGVALAAAFALAALVARRHARAIGEDPALVASVWLGLVVSSFIGARVLFVVTNPQRLAEALVPWQGGDLVFYGGALGCLVFLAAWSRWRRVPLPRVVDLLIPSVALGHAIGRVGCFAAGCCYGAASDAPWAVRFPRESLAFQQLVADGTIAFGTVTPPLHPVQLYEAAGELALFFALSWLLARRRYVGQVFVAWLAGYGLLRIVTERFRGDEERRFVVAHLSTSQALALVALVVAVAVELASRRRRALVAAR